MDVSIVRNVRPGWLLAIVLSLTCGVASAAPLPSYNVIDLGAGWAGFASGPDGRGVVATVDGRMFDFPVSNSALSGEVARAIIASFAPMTNAPVNNPATHGNPAYAYSNLSGDFLNGRGQLVVTNRWGVSGYSSGGGSALLTAQRQSDGSFGPLSHVPGYGSDGNGPLASAVGLNDMGQVLYTSGFAGFTFYQLANINTGQVTDLTKVLPAGWKISRLGGLHDTGRILVMAEPDRYSGNTGDRSFLLEPAAVPEASTLATLGASLLGPIASRHRRRGKRRHGAGHSGRTGPTPSSADSLAGW